DSIAMELAQEGIPYPTVSLRRVAEWQSRIRVECAPVGDDAPAMATRAIRLVEYGVRLSEMGQPEPALKATRQAVSLYRSLASCSPNTFLPDLATSLSNLGEMLHELGQRKPALAATTESVDL